MKAKKGSCLCGAVGFEVSGDFESFFLCHCKFCQKDTGSAHAANLFSSKAEIEWISEKNFDPRATRSVLTPNSKAR